MQGGEDQPAHVVKDSKGRVIAVLVHYSDAVQLIAESPCKTLTLVQEPGLMAIIGEFCGRPHVGEDRGH